MFGQMKLLTRNALQNAIRNAYYHGGTPGENLPFSMRNKYRLTFLYAVFFGSGLGAPFLILRHQLKKK